MLAGVGAVRHAETKFKVKTFEESVLEVMSLNHSEPPYFSVTHGEIHAK